MEGEQEMTYKEYKENRQKSFSDLPIFWAFSMDQFREQMEKRGLTENDTDKIYAFGGGGYYLRSDAPVIRAYFEKKDPLPELMANYDFAYEAFMYELGNHEYHINWQGNWDVMNCFGNVEYEEGKGGRAYLRDMGYGGETEKAWCNARKDFLRMAEEKDWY